MKVVVPATNVAELLRRRAARDAAKIALVDGARRLTWLELESRVDEVARGLADCGVIAGHRVVIALANSVEFVVAYLATLRCGAVAVPVHASATVAEGARVLTDCGPRLCFVDDATATAVRGAFAVLREGDTEQRSELSPAAKLPSLVITGADPLPGELAYDDLRAPGGEVMSPRDTEALAVLLYTAGTSGRPQAAMLTHRALLANADQASRTAPPPVRPDDVVLGSLPLSHVYGLGAVLGQVLLQGATLVLGRRFGSVDMLQLIAAEQVTCVPVAPPVIAAWLRRDDLAHQLRSVRTVLSGGAPLAAELVVAFSEATGLVVERGYGLTEAGPIVTSTLGMTRGKPGSAGRALPGVEVRVVDAAGDDLAGHEVEGDDPGEIWVRGRNLFSGYWPDGQAAPSADGWLATGDVGFLDEDGDLYLLDRLTDVVVVSGFSVYPAEVEDVVRELPQVLDCAVIGVPDEQTGAAVVAYVVASPAATSAVAETVRAHCEQRLARFKVPASVLAVTELPRAATGRVAKSRLRAAQGRRELGLS